MSHPGRNRKSHPYYYGTKVHNVESFETSSGLKSPGPAVIHAHAYVDPAAGEHAGRCGHDGHGRRRQWLHCLCQRHPRPPGQHAQAGAGGRPGGAVDGRRALQG
eukprot:5789350-Prymnesium_polylepis.1